MDYALRGRSVWPETVGHDPFIRVVHKQRGECRASHHSARCVSPRGAAAAQQQLAQLRRRSSSAAAVQEQQQAATAVPPPLSDWWPQLYSEFERRVG